MREAFEQRRTTDMKLALVGDAPYAADYIARVRDTQDPRIVMPGAIYGAGLSRTADRTASPTSMPRRWAERIRR